MQRLLKRRKIQECLEETEKEMGDGGMSLNDLESLLNEEGIDTKIESLPTRRIASNNTTRYLLINNVKQALAQAKKKKEDENNPATSETDLIPDENMKSPKKDELEQDLEKAIKLSLECANEADTSTCTSKTDDSWTTVMTDSEYSYSDSEEEDGFQQPDNMSSAKVYIMQYSDYTHKAIEKLVAYNKNNKPKPIVPNVDNVLEEINNEKSVIIDKLEISSSDDEDCKIKSNDAANMSRLHLNNREVERRQSIDEMDEDLQKAIKMSLESVSGDNSNYISKADNSIISITPDIEQSESDANESSLICEENRIQNISLLDTSTDENEKITSDLQNDINTDNIKQESLSEESSDDDFEEVPESITNKPVVQLTLKMDEVSEDDIFADVFTIKSESVRDSTKNNVNSKTQRTKTFNSNSESEFKQEDVELSVFKISGETINNSKVTSDETRNNSKETISVSHTVKLTGSLTKSIPEKVDTLSVVAKSVSKDNSEVINKANPLTSEQLNSMADELQNQEDNLIQEKGRLDRIGRNITEQMTKEAQELLQLFGIPYVIAPMEAEAQCAFLEEVKLTDGTITDDSDIWLFGGKTVYKNFFNQKKHVLQFLAERIERSFNLTREQLILLALLVGSDYTVGVTGVGPVTALEILASFPFNKKQLQNETSKQAQYNQIITGLHEFKRWVRAGKRTDNISLKKKLRNINITDDFPSVRVVQAYLEPNIEKSEEKFTWGEIDITLLRDYTKSKFGWSQNKLDEIIKPVLKRIHDRKNQKSLRDYFKTKSEFQSLEDQMSKRVKAAVQKMGPDPVISVEQNIDTEKPKRKRLIKKNKEKNIITTPQTSAAPSKPKKAKNSVESVLNSHNVKIVAQKSETESSFDIKIHKTDRLQDIIPQREKDKQNLLQNRLKAIEIFRKTNIDKKMKVKKRRPNLPKEKANLSESSDSD